MKISRASVALAAVAVVLLSVELPASGQDTPESLLPPGFGEQPAPTPTPSPTPRPDSATTTGGATPRPAGGAEQGDGAIVQPTPSPTPTPSDTPTPSPTPLSAEELLKYELPPFARRSLTRTGFAAPPEGGLGLNAFGQADGQYLETLMRRLDTPLPSRWMHIGLRRALTSVATTPPYVNGADFAAERAWLLLRMGEANAARAVVDTVDTENYTPKLFQIAMQAALATADPAGLCPLQRLARVVSPEKSWALAEAMCAGLAGKPKQASRLIDAAEDKDVASGVDLRLAEKVIGQGAQGNRSATIEWTGVDGLTSWRYGLATATGADIPEDLLDEASPQVHFWRALAPMLSPSERLADADRAAAQGVLSADALVDLYGTLERDTDASSAQIAMARDLRSAYTEQAPADRVAMLRRLWTDPMNERERFARNVLTAYAASRVPPAAAYADAAPALIGSMLTAGLDRQAMRWAGAVKRGSAAWALLALADPDPIEPLGASAIDAYRISGAAGDSFKTRMLFAGLAGLGRIKEGDVPAIARDLNVQLGASNAWTNAIDGAGERGEKGTVMLLAAIGMQTGNWRGVPPEALFHIVAAMRAAGLEGYGRMIAAEAVSRL
ncbi:hypothetical protein [Stakelama saccharophila]|uniref:Uncharacterized protein n=1 Tax=Stakelama saccharophila TaxID=3075605 RepID=A0ABZ0B5T8_9SPHN|nr:hypothetical protein [Stakelama sp. W311]WNO52669.1 hypothetical protein RPR59_09350 [Stakelama sp. W311]